LRLPALLNHFVQARAEGIYDRLLKRLAKLSVLIIDDFGLAAMSDREKQELLEAVEERYGSGATVVTAQLPVSDWHEYLGGGRVADAILDRLVHAAHRIELRSPESMRKDYSALNHDGQSVVGAHGKCGSAALSIWRLDRDWDEGVEALGLVNVHFDFEFCEGRLRAPRIIDVCAADDFGLERKVSYCQRDRRVNRFGGFTQQGAKHASQRFLQVRGRTIADPHEINVFGVAARGTEVPLVQHRAAAHGNLIRKELVLEDRGDSFTQ
jgi:hypothetical protein